MVTDLSRNEKQRQKILELRYTAIKILIKEASEVTKTGVAGPGYGPDRQDSVTGL